MIVSILTEDSDRSNAVYDGALCDGYKSLNPH